MLVSLPGGAALAAECCIVATEASAASEISDYGSDCLAAAHNHDSAAIATTVADTGLVAGHEHSPNLARGLPLPASSELPDADNANQDDPVKSFPFCGLSACPELPQASLSFQATLGHQASPASFVVPETRQAERHGFLQSIFRPPRA